MKLIRAPWGHQNKAIPHAITYLPGYGLFFDMGTGKTFTSIAMVIAHFQGTLARVIIFCPPLVVPNWVEEWKKNTDVNMRDVIPLYGPGPKRLKTFLEQSSRDTGKIFITNYESLLMKPLFEAMFNWAPQALIFDESHNCKSHSAQRSKKADELANPFNVKLRRKEKKPYTLILSGTPVLNSPMDLFQQFKILDGGERFGYNFFQFRGKFFRDRNAGMPKERYFPKWELMTGDKDGFDAEARIKELMSDISMRVLKSECLDLPPEISIIQKVGMSQQQARLYKEMKDDFVTFFNSQACTATLAIVKALRLMQITSGFVSVESRDGDDIEQVAYDLENTPKDAALRELLQELVIEGKHKVLIWSVWRHNYGRIQRICDELGIRSVQVNGDISSAQQRKNVDTFKNDPDCMVFSGHPGSGGIGINLVEAGYSIFYSRNFKLVEYLQARARNHRGGSLEQGHENITHYDLVCDGTIDELAVQKLASKFDMSEKLLDGNFLKDLVAEIKSTTRESF